MKDPKKTYIRIFFKYISRILLIDFTTMQIKGIFKIFLCLIPLKLEIMYKEYLYHLFVNGITFKTCSFVLTFT